MGNSEWTCVQHLWMGLLLINILSGMQLCTTHWRTLRSEMEQLLYHSEMQLVIMQQ